MLIAVGFYFLVKPDLGALERERRLSPLLFALLPALLIGFYDGFFGPGTGTFFALAFVTLAGYQITKATAHAKLLNFISNISALLYFAIFKELIWEIGILMFIGQVIGANFGARLVIGKGTTIIRPILVVVCFSIASKLIYDYFSSFSG